MRVTVIREEELPLPAKEKLRQTPEEFADTEDGLYGRIGSGYVRIEKTEDAPALTMLLKEDRNGENRQDRLQRICRRLLESTDEHDAETLIKSSGLAEIRIRHVMIFETSGEKSQNFFGSMKEIVPVEGNEDQIVGMSDTCCALIKNTEAMEPEETEQFAAAVADSLREEAGITVHVGVSLPFRNLRTVRLAYVQAQKASRLGQLFHRIGPVYSYRMMRLERLLDAIPEEGRKKYLLEAVTPDSRRVFSSDNRQWLEVFFRNDLNLSNAARDLFLHRNTLVYRMDKIYRDTGLDIRHFQDAMVLKLLLDLQDVSSQSSGKQDGNQ